MRASTGRSVDLSLIGPDRRQRTRLGRLRRAGLWLTLADLVGLAAGVALAAALILIVVV